MADSIQLSDLKTLVAAESDLSRYSTNDALLQYALDWASSEILKRRGVDTLEDQYLMNQVQGALYFLSRLGTEGAYSTSENGEQTVFQQTPGFLQSVIPRLGTVRDA